MHFFKNKRFLIIIILIIILIIGGFVFYRSSKGEEKGFPFEEIKKGTVVEEISESGIVENSEKLDLGFDSAGRIEKIYVREEEDVLRGQELAKLDTTQLEIQLEEAKAGLKVIKAQQENTEVSLGNAKKDLENAQRIAKENLKIENKRAIDAIEDSYLKSYNVFNVINDLKEKYFERGDWESITMSDEKNNIEKMVKEISNHRNYTIDSSTDDIEESLLIIQKSLLKIKKSLEEIRKIADTSGYQKIISDADKSLIDNQQVIINTAYNSVVECLSKISSVKATNKANIDKIQAQIKEIESQLKGKSDGFYTTKIEQAQVQISLLENKIMQSVLKSPADGKIIKIYKKEGEVAQFGEKIMSLLYSKPFEIKVDIYEEDVGKIKVGNPVKITFPALPNKEYSGTVVFINPIEKVINDVVYYEVKIVPNENIKNIKTGMTADVVIITNERKDVLVVPKEAIHKKDDKKFVNVLKDDGTFEEREIKVGLEGDDVWEVISGLKEGEKVITGKK
ncbi:MAG TPA: efflux RND transporter periplasmic adaptor subunit [Candidatus Pacearchaeota archaeon]|nr:efflux RND transporter periplasmic adaptor subunit [Candidatus Pacearchaeota archaeon]